jgi:DNA-binding GntR family transcriptional regulator
VKIAVLPRQSLRDAAYDAIKHKITTCAFKPGEYLNEASVSAMLGIGRTPVHQAVDRLMLEGMLEVIPRKGVIVKPLGLQEILQVIEVRLIVETNCARLAANRASNEEIRNLVAIQQRAKAWVAARNSEQLMLLDRDFHDVLARSTGNDVIADLLMKLNARSLRYWFVSLDTPGHHGKVHEQHNAILAAIRRRNPDEAERTMRDHIEDFRRNVTAAI